MRTMAEGDLNHAAVIIMKQKMPEAATDPIDQLSTENWSAPLPLRPNLIARNLEWRCCVGARIVAGADPIADA